LFGGAEPLVDQGQDAAAARETVVRLDERLAVVCDDRHPITASTVLRDPSGDWSPLLIQFGEGDLRTVRGDDREPSRSRSRGIDH
jgi:hypothetical protein